MCGYYLESIRRGTYPQVQTKEIEAMPKTAKTRPEVAPADTAKKQTKASKPKFVVEIVPIDATLAAEPPKPKKQPKASAVTEPAATDAPAAAVAMPATADAKPAKAVPALNALGSRIGTKAAAVDAVLTKTPQTMKAIMAAAGQERTFYNHLNKLVRDGKVKKSAEGYALP